MIFLLKQGNSGKFSKYCNHIITRAYCEKLRPPGPFRNSSVPLWVVSSIPWKNSQGMTRYVPWSIRREWVSQGEGWLTMLLTPPYVLPKWMCLRSCYSHTCCQKPPTHFVKFDPVGWGHCHRKKKNIAQACFSENVPLVGPRYALAFV